MTTTSVQTSNTDPVTDPPPPLLNNNAIQPLDFQKRDITGSSKSKLYSQLSSLSLHSLNSNPRIANPLAHKDEIIPTIDDRERISSPASTAALLASGHQTVLPAHHNESFDNFTGFRSNSLKSDTPFDAGAGAGAGDSPAVSPRNVTRNASLPELDLRHIQRFSKHYEPARAVLHRTEFNKDSNDPHSQGGLASRNAQSRQSLNYTMSNSQQAMQAQQASSNLLMHLGSSPESLNTPLRQIRDLKQPSYVPAVLRPTLKSNYQSSNSVVSVGKFRQPATKHWVNDSNVSDCRSCGRPFNLFRRKHHCRKCGDVFCATDVDNVIGLDQSLNFNLLGQPCKACDTCANEFQLIAQDAPRAETPNDETH